jgi:hypothetical protein
MADDIRLVIGVEQSGLLKAITATETLETKVKKLSAAYARDAASYGRYNKAVGNLAKATNKNKKELLAYGTALRADEKATKKATAEVKAFTIARKEATAINQKITNDKRLAVKATEDLARAEAKNAASLKTMRMATDGVYRNQQKRLQMKKLLKTAIVAEKMSTEQAIVALKRYNAAQMSSTKVMGTAKNKMNGNNMAVQQLGYQFGDFAVQVQGGTSAFVAFSQQGAQLAGMLPMIAGPLGLTMGAAVGLSAALGILIPIGSAVGRMFFEMRDEAKEAKVSAKGLEERIKSLTESLKEYGRIKESIKLGISPEVMDIGEKITQAKAAVDAAQAIVDANKDIQAGSAEESASQFGDLMEVEAAVKALAVAKKLLFDLTAREADEQKKLHDAEISSRNSAVSSIQQEARFQGELFGMTSEGQERANELRAFQNELIEAGIKPLGHQYLEALKYYHQMVQNREATANQAKALEDAAAAQELLSSTGLGYKAQLLLVNTQIQALKEGKNAEVAAFIEGERVKVTAIYETSKALHLQTGNVIALAEASLTFLDAMSSLDSLAAAKAKLGELKAPDGRGSGGGKDPRKQLAEYLSGKQQELELETKLVGIFGDERDIQTELFNIKSKYSKVITSDQRKELENILRLTLAEKERQAALEEAQSQQQALADTLESSMSDAFTSMVDGTKSFKDAMKDMARAVIKQLFEILVVQRLVGSFDAKSGTGSGLVGLISGAIGGGGGNLFGGTSWSANGDVVGSTGIQAYANGGVVDSPTMFQHGGGLGVMGEAGPEAIMPLKRGSNGKLGVQMEGSGGGDTIVVHQNFNFQSNGDDSIKKLIAQAAPQISAMTKSSLLNDRRRGGATKAAFG